VLAAQYSELKVNETVMSSTLKDKLIVIEDGQCEKIITPKKSLKKTDNLLQDY